MAFVYEVNGEKIEFDHEPTNIDIDEAARSLGNTKTKPQSFGTQLGHGTASLADTALNALTGTLDYGAYGLARAAGLSPEEAIKQTTSPKDVIGRGLGITQSPSYQNEASRQIIGGLGQGVHAVAQPISEQTGLPQSDVEHMIGTGMMAAGPVVPKVATTVGRGLGEVAMAPVNFGKGALQGMAYPEGSGAKSSLVPINPKEYYPPEAVKQFQNGQINLQQLEATKTTPQHLYENKPAANWAYGMAPENAQGMKSVPAEGNLVKGVGEIVGSGIRKNPLQGIADLAGLYSGIGPVGSVIKAVPAGASAILNKATKLDPNFMAQKAAASTIPVPQTRPISPAEVAQQAAVSHIQNAQTQAMTTPVPAPAPTPAPMPQPQSVITKAQEMQQRLDQTRKELESQGLEINPPTETPKEPTPLSKSTEEIPIKNLGKISGIRAGKKAIELAESSGEPTKFSIFEKGKGHTIYTFNKQIKFAPDPDLNLTKSIQYNNGSGNIDFSGTLRSTGEPITVKLIKDGDITVFGKDGNVLKVFGTKGNLINQSTTKQAPSNVSQMLTEPSHLSNIPKQFEEGINNSQGRIVAELKDGGQWEHGDHKYKLEHLEHGQKRIQVKDSKGAVVYEKYYD